MILSESTRDWMNEQDGNQEVLAKVVRQTQDYVQQLRAGLKRNEAVFNADKAAALPGNFRRSQSVYFTGSLEMWCDGQFLLPNEKGLVLGPATGGDMATCVSVSFSRFSYFACPGKSEGPMRERGRGRGSGRGRERGSGRETVRDRCCDSALRPYGSEAPESLPCGLLRQKSKVPWRPGFQGPPESRVSLGRGGRQYVNHAWLARVLRRPWLGRSTHPTPLPTLLFT